MSTEVPAGAHPAAGGSTATAPPEASGGSAAAPQGAAGSSDRITLVGLILETAAGLRRQLAPGLGCELGVGGQSFEILLRLSRSTGGSLRMSDLAGQTGLTPSGLTRAVDRLSEAGLVARSACPQDRRGSFAILTDLGRQRMDEAMERHGRDVDALLDGVLGAEEEGELRSLLRALRDRVHPEATLGAGGTCGSAAPEGPVTPEGIDR